LISQPLGTLSIDDQLTPERRGLIRQELNEMSPPLATVSAPLHRGGHPEHAKAM
jgi:hypothetical protein